MGYRVVDPGAVMSPGDRPCELRSLSSPAGLDEMAINLFRAAPGEQVPLAYHYHEKQEEVFYVLSGTLFVETPEHTYEVPEGHLFAVDPESPHRAHNPETGDGSVELLAIGAPPASDDAVAYDDETDDAVSVGRPDAGGPDDSEPGHDGLGHGGADDGRRTTAGTGPALPTGSEDD